MTHLISLLSKELYLNYISCPVSVYFGTYHHSSLQESERTRERVKGMFADLLPSLFSVDSKIKVLDAGCGLGFLSSVVAEIFPNATLVGIDTFGDDSLRESSLKIAQSNIRTLGFGNRVKLRKHNLLEPISGEPQYDLIVSNLVFHNLGRRRFEGYKNVVDILRKGGYFAVGDLFPNEKTDSYYLESILTLIREIEGEGNDRWKYKIKVFKKVIRSREELGI